jgi:hypothetical protein
MLLIDAEGDMDGAGDLNGAGDLDGEGDMPLIDGDGDGDGDVPGICMFIEEPPMPMLWWMATHQFHTSVWTGPAT